jgi:hypothetical protein
MTHSVGPIFTETSVIVTVSVLGAVGIAWAIVVGIITVSKIIVRHRERMAQIGMTINGQQPGSSQSGTDSAYRSEWPQKSAAG